MLEGIVIAIAIGLDRITKIWCKAYLVHQPGMQMNVIPGVVEFKYMENTGAAFSVFSGKTWLLAAFSIIIIAALVFFLIKYGGGEPLLVRLCVAAIIGGAVGNLIDRLFYGYVIDFINPTFINFAIFNVADMFVTCGAILLVFLLLFFKPREKKEEIHDGEI
ncbi:signal peptidase II [Eubacteriales bacterium OttesenSCG-928-M02]|nr:signal peptidase II [Eubacteriales bacterium OttesenSCG-928-M02]